MFAGQPVLELDRFYAAPRNRLRAANDAQSAAVERLVLRCESLRPHLHSLETLERFVQSQHDPARIRRRISLALAIETPQSGLMYGRVGRIELETFRTLAERKLAAVIWVFS